MPIGPDNDTLVKFLDLDGDPNEGHENEVGTPATPKVTASNAPPQGDLEPEVEVDMTDAPAADAETPVVDVLVTEEPATAETAPVEEEAKAEEKLATEDKLTPWQRTAQLKRELAEEKRLREEATARQVASEQRLQQIETYLQQQAAAVQRPAQQNGNTPQEPAKVPEFEENPLGNLATRQTMTEQIIGQFNQRQQQLEAQNIRQQFESRINLEEAGYAQSTNPDYYNARNYLIESAWKEGRAAGMNDQQIRDTIEAYRVQFARTAWTQNKPIAEVVEQVAQSRGYRPETERVAITDAATTPAVTAKEKVQHASRREEQAKSSLAQAARTTGRPPTKITREMILNATESEMDAWDAASPGWLDAHIKSAP